MQALTPGASAASSSSEAVFLASIEAKLRKPFSSLNVSKAIEREADPVAYIRSVKDLVFKKSGSGDVDAGSSSLNVDKTLKLRLLLSLLGLEHDTLGFKNGENNDNDIWNVLWATLRNAQESDEDIWVQMVGGYVQGFLFGKPNSDSTGVQKNEDTGSAPASTSKETNLRPFLGNEAESKLNKTNQKFLKELLKAWNKLGEGSRRHSSNNGGNGGKTTNSRDCKDEIAFYAPAKYHVLEPCILKQNLPSLYDNSHFTVATGNSSTGNRNIVLPSILNIDMEHDQQRALEEERELEDNHSSNALSKGPNYAHAADSGGMSNDLTSSPASRQTHPADGVEGTAADGSIRKSSQEEKLKPGTETAKANTAASNSRKGISATAKMLKSGVRGPPRSAFTRGVRPGGAQGSGMRMGGGGMSEAAKKALAARQNRMGGQGARGVIGSSVDTARSGIPSLLGRMHSRKLGAGVGTGKALSKGSGGGKMKMAVLDVSDVREIEKERQSGTTGRRRGGGRGGTNRGGAASRTVGSGMKRPMSYNASSVQGSMDRKRPKALSGFEILREGNINNNSHMDDKDVEDSDDDDDDEEVSKTEVDIIGRFGAASEDDDEDDGDEAQDNAMDSALANNPLNLDGGNNISASTTDSGWGMSMPDIQTNLMFGSSMANPFGTADDDDDDD